MTVQYHPSGEPGTAVKFSPEVIAAINWFARHLYNELRSDGEKEIASAVFRTLQDWDETEETPF